MVLILSHCQILNSYEHSLLTYRYVSVETSKCEHNVNIAILLKSSCRGGCQGDSSVLFAYLFLLLFGKIDNIYKVEQDYLYCFLEANSRGIIQEKINLPFPKIT